MSDNQSAKIEPSAHDKQALDDKTRQEAGVGSPIKPGVAFPWGMLFIAIIFDLIGLIPIINFLTELLAGLIFGLWQKSYVPKLDPVLTFIVAKIIDAMFLGLLPSNIAIVVYSYIKKKSLQISGGNIGRMALKKVSVPETQQI